MQKGIAILLFATLSVPFTLVFRLGLYHLHRINIPSDGVWMCLQSLGTIRSGKNNFSLPLGIRNHGARMDSKAGNKCSTSVVVVGCVSCPSLSISPDPRRRVKMYGKPPYSVRWMRLLCPCRMFSSFTLFRFSLHC